MATVDDTVPESPLEIFPRAGRSDSISHEPNDLRLPSGANQDAFKVLQTFFQRRKPVIVYTVQSVLPDTTTPVIEVCAIAQDLCTHTRLRLQFTILFTSDRGKCQPVMILAVRVIFLAATLVLVQIRANFKFEIIIALHSDMHCELSQSCTLCTFCMADTVYRARRA